MIYTIFNDDSQLLSSQAKYKVLKKEDITFGLPEEVSKTICKGQKRFFTSVKITESKEDVSYFDVSGRVLSVNLILNLTRFVLNGDPVFFINSIQAKREKTSSTVEQVEELYNSIVENNIPILDDLELDYSLRDNALKHVSGMQPSDFKSRAIKALESGIADYTALVYACYFTLDEEKKNLGLPLNPYDFEAEKAADLPSKFVVKYINRFYGFYGPSGFMVCSDSNDQGVCFNMNPDNIEDQKIGIGDLLSLRGSTDGLSKNQRWLKLQRVKMKKLEEGF